MYSKISNIDKILHYKQHYKENGTLPAVIENIEVIYPQALQQAVHEKFNIGSDQFDPISYLHFQHFLLEAEINWLKERLPSVKQEWKLKDMSYYNHVCQTFNDVLQFFDDQVKEVKDGLYARGELEINIKVIEGNNLKTFKWNNNGDLGLLYQRLNHEYIKATKEDFRAAFGFGKLNKPIIWGSDYVLFAFFLDKLKPFIPKIQFNRRFSIASKLFVNDKNEYFTNTSLARYRNNYRANDKGEPKDSNSIKEILDAIKFEV